MTLRELETKFATPTRDNCKGLILAVRKALGDGSIPSLGLQSYLDKVIDGFRPDADKELLTVYGRIVAADMLLLQKSNSLKSLRDKLLLFISYAAATVKSSYDFVGLAANALCYKVIHTGLDWKAVEDAGSLDLLSYKLINGISFDKSSSDFFSFTGKGKVECRDGRLRIFSSNVGETGDTAYSVFGGAVEIVTRNSRDERLKASEQNDAEALGRFCRIFTEAQKNYVNRPSRKRSYANGDKVDICLTGLSEDEQFQYAETVDDFEPTECKLYNEELYRGINTQDLLPYLRDGEIIRDAQVVKFDDSMFFSVKDAYRAFATEAANRDMRENNVVKAKAIRVLDDIKRINWMNSEGYGGISIAKDGETVRVGDVIPMTVKSVLRQNNALYVNLGEPWSLPDTPLPEFDDDKVFRNFQIDKRTYYRTKEAESQEASSQNLVTVKLLASILAHRSAHLGGLLRYRSLLSALFLNNEKEIYFKETLLPNITIEPTPDLDAIRISVAPAEYEIAYLYSDRTHSDGQAFMRDGGHTIPMTEAQKARRLTSLKRISKEMDFIVIIQEAIDQHRKLILKDYASCSSGKINDRLEVPVNLIYNDESVYCLDLDDKQYKQFRLMRIGSIETEMEDPVYTLPLQPPIKADVFRWTDMGKQYHIRLRMDIAARNIFVEEYSMAKFLPEKEFYRDSDGKWILDTVVYRLGAVSRFYLGLADKIEILPTEDSPALKEGIARFLKENLYKH